MIGWDKEAQEHKARLDKLIKQNIEIMEQNQEIIKLLKEIRDNTGSYAE